MTRFLVPFLARASRVNLLPSGSRVGGPAVASFATLGPTFEILPTFETFAHVFRFFWQTAVNIEEDLVGGWRGGLRLNSHAARLNSTFENCHTLSLE